MALSRLKKFRIRKAWRIGALFCALMGVAWWAAAAYGDGSKEDVRQPAMEVSESKPAALAKTERPEACVRPYIVQQGDTLSEIAEKYHIDLDTLVGANEDLEENIQPGERLAILAEKGVLYKVENGDSLWGIARLFGVEAKEILRANGKSTDFLEAGEQLLLPGAKPLRKDISNVSVSRAAEAKFILPATGQVSSPFGWRWGRLHKGMDIADDEGTPILAAMSGKVVHAGWISGYGNAVILQHRRGYSTLYGHMRQILVEQGMAVRQGEPVGRMGSTGNSTGPHVHFEVMKDGDPVNPVSVLR